MDGRSDENLVDGFRESGDLRCLDELVCRHVERVRAMIYPMVLNNADADELTQEVFLRAVTGLAGFRGKSRFSTWLHRIAINTTLSFLRRKGRSPVESRENPPDSPDTAPGPGVSAETREMDAAASRALGSLSPALRSAIALTAIQGMSVKEAAAATGCLAATMYWRVHQARKILRNQLAEYF